MDSPLPPRRGPGRPPGSKNRPKILPIEGQGETTDETSNGSPAYPVEVRTICGMEFGTRRNGEFPPKVVRKLALAQLARGMSQRDIVDRVTKMGVEIGQTRLYGWYHNAGLPNAEQIAALSEVLDVSSDYLMDDSLPELADPPRQMQYRVPDLSSILAAYGLNLMDLKQYARIIRTAKDLELEPAQVVRMLISGYSEIVEYRKAEERKARGLDGPYDYRNDEREVQPRKGG